MLDNLKEDYYRYGTGKATSLRFCSQAIRSAGFRALLLYRTGRWFRKNRCGLLAAITERITHHLCHCWISTFAEIGAGLLIAHVGGLVIGGNTRIGKNCDVRQNVTFGGNFKKRGAEGRTQPWVGDNVSIGAGAVVIGPITVGSNSVIGANSVVNSDVPENVIVFGVPAKVIKERWDESSGRGL
jgi:serine O-acetyltransferase